MNRRWVAYNSASRQCLHNAQEKSGELGLDKFTRMFPGQDAALIERMFDLFDTDGSGIIELRKFIIGTCQIFEHLLVTSF